MKRTIMIAPFILLVVMLSFLAASCANIAGGAVISLEGMTLGQVTMEGKAVSGLPSDKVNLLLEVGAQKVVITTNGDRTTIGFSPSGGTIEIKGKDIAIRGLRPEQVKVEWATAK
ncbi:MAG: hypothetical protein Q8O76_02865 [Chloroflexota bacterium]|nr:hypothetical protein [Chloroflexota bacterium]